VSFSAIVACMACCCQPAIFQHWRKAFYFLFCFFVNIFQILQFGLKAFCCLSQGLDSPAKRTPLILCCLLWAFSRDLEASLSCLLRLSTAFSASESLFFIRASSLYSTDGLPAAANAFLCSFHRFFFPCDFLELLYKLLFLA